MPSKYRHSLSHDDEDEELPVGASASSMMRHNPIVPTVAQPRHGAKKRQISVAMYQMTGGSCVYKFLRKGGNYDNCSFIFNIFLEFNRRVLVE